MAFDLTARIRLEDKATSQLRRLERSFDRLDRSTRSSSSAVDRFDRTMTSTSASSRSMTETGRRSADSIDRMGRSAKKATNDVDRLNRSMKKAGDGGGLFGNLDFSGVGGMFKQLTGIASRITGMITRAIRNAMLAGGAALGGAVYASSRAVKFASDSEQARVAYSTMLGSEEAGAAFQRDVFAFSERTGFELPGLRDSSKRLLAFGFDVESIIPMMEALGNAASGLSLGSDGIDRLALIFGQIRAKGRLQGEEALQLAEAGIPAYDMLAKKMQVSSAEVMDLMSKGVIPAEGAINALIEGMNERFPDMVDKQAETLDGMWKRMKNIFDIRILQNWGDGLADVLRPKMRQAVMWIDANRDTITRWGETVRETAGQAADWIAGNFDRAFSYISERYINNPEFTDLDFASKVGFVIDDLAAKFNEWLDGGGRERIQKFSDDVGQVIGEFIGSGLESMAPVLADVAWNAGSEFAAGFMGRVNEKIGDTFFGWAPGRKGKKNTELLSGFLDRAKDTPDGQPMFPGEAMMIPSHAGGLSRVPYNGYVARLHKDEEVLTAEEARERRNGGGSGGVVITGNTFNVREESDIPKIATELVRMMNQAAHNGA